MDTNDEYENSEEDINIFEYIKENYIQFLLFISVFFIIYLVDYISNINAQIFVMPSPIPGVPQPSIGINTKRKIKIKNKNKK